MKAKMKSTKLTLSLGASCCLVALLLVVASITEARGQREEDEDRSRVTRQAAGSRASGDRQQVGVSMAAAAEVSTTSGGSAAKPARPMMSTPDVAPETAEDQDEEQPRPRKKQNKIKRPKSRPVVSSADDDYRRGRYEDSEDCDEDDQDGYGNMFESMASNPMQHIRRMMNNVLDRMPNNFGFYPGDDDYYGGRGSGVASSAAAAFNSRDGGYSKLSSSVTNNGRTRGIISETRNGRTKTRRIGDDRDDTEE